MSDTRASIEVIIPTTCITGRWAVLQRAIGTVASQDAVNVRVLVVVNGDRFDPDCLAALRARSDLRVHYQLEGNLPLALRVGRSLVEAPFFCFLDDDDEYLPGALAYRVQPMLADPRVDFTASVGLRCVDGGDRLALTELQVDQINAQPLLSLGVENWLASCGGLYRSSSISLDYFDGVTQYYEWTYLAYRLAIDKTLRYLERPTFRINDSSDSLSKSAAYRLAEIDVLHKLLDLPLPRKAQVEIRRKIGSAHHRISDYCLEQGWRMPAWQHHLKSLLYPGGWKYSTYSRHLLLQRSKA